MIYSGLPLCVLCDLSVLLPLQLSRGLRVSATVRLPLVPLHVRSGCRSRTKAGFDHPYRMKDSWPYCSLWQATQLAAYQNCPEQANMSHDLTRADPALRGAIEQVGGVWIEKPVVTDGYLVTAADIQSIESFCEAFAQSCTEHKASSGSSIHTD